MNETPVYSQQYKGLRVLGLLGDEAACAHYRIVNPLTLLGQHGADVYYSAFNALVRVHEFDIVLAPRQHNKEVYEFLMQALWNGKIVIYENDDDLHSVLPDSPAYTIYHPGSEDLHMVGRMTSIAHGFTCTTPEIAKWYSQYNTNVRVVENYIDFSLRDWNVKVNWVNGIPQFYQLPRRKLPEWEDKVVIGWSGGSTHGPDLGQMGGAVRNVLQNYPNTIFAIYTGPQLAESFVKDHDLPRDRVVFIPARKFADHPTGLHGIDIQLAPILGCQFNLAKSSLKVLEGLASRAAVVASNVGPYARFERRHPGSILTVGDGTFSFPTWESAISRLVEDNDLRRKMQNNGVDLTTQQYSLENRFHEWPRAWSEIYAEAKEGRSGPPDRIGKPGEYRSFGKTNRNDDCPCGSGRKYKKCCRSAWG